MNRNIVIFIGAVVVAVALAIGLNSYLQHSATIGGIRKAVENLANKDDPDAVDKAVRALREDDIELWFHELTSVYDLSASQVQKRNIMEVLGKKAPLMIGERRDQAVALLEGAFQDTDEKNATTAIEVITRDYKNESSAAKLRLIIRGGDRRMGVKMAALEGLGRISSKDEDVNLLGDYLANEHAVLRMAAVRGMAEMRTVNSLRALYARLTKELDIAPAEKNLVVRMDLLRKVGELGGELKNESGELKNEDGESIVEYLERFLRETTFTSLYMQSLVTTSDDNIAEMERYLNIDNLGEMRLKKSNALETGVFAAALEALYRLGAGDRYTVALERIQARETTPDGRAILEGALINYFDFLLAPNGSDMPLSDVDRARLLSVSNRLAGLMEGDEAMRDFAQDSLATITGRPDIDTRDGWMKYLGKFNDKDKKFEPAGRTAE